MTGSSSSPDAGEADVLPPAATTARSAQGAEAESAPEHSQGQKARIERLLRDYFVARDKGWLGSTPSALAAGVLADGEVEPKAVQQASSIAIIAKRLAGKRGLRATAVHTGLARKKRIELHGSTATATVTVGTALSWNIASVGDSSFSDRYIVQLERRRGTWRITDVDYAPIPSTELPDRQNDSVTGPADATREHLGEGDAPKAAPVQPRATGQYDRAAAAAYARYWSRNSVLYNGDLLVGDLYNPEYERQDNDCTNFASQALHAGGWPIHDGFANDNPVNWTPDLWGPRGPSKTWSVASWLYDYAGNPLRGEKWRIWPPDDDNMDIWNLQPGDLLFVDWDPDGHYDGAIDHAMVISGTYTELGFTEPTYSQHTPHRHNLPLSVGIKIATAPKPPVDPGDGMGGQGRIPKYYPVHVKDTFTVE